MAGIITLITALAITTEGRRFIGITGITIIGNKITGGKARHLREEIMTAGHSADIPNSKARMKGEFSEILTSRPNVP